MGGISKLNRHISSAIRRFRSKLIQSHSKETIQQSAAGLLCVNPPVIVGFPAQSLSKAESVFMS